MNSNLLIQLSESDKRVLIALLLALIIVIILFGYLVKIIKYILKRKCDFVSTSMYDLLDANVVKDAKHFRKFSWQKNRIKFYFEARLPIFFIILSWFIILLYMCVVGFDLSFIGKYTQDLTLVLDWSESGDLLLDFIPVFANWPKVVKVPVFHFDKIDAWLTYLFDLGILYGTIHFVLCSIVLLARNIKTITLSHDYFKKDIEQLKQAKLKARQINTKEPSEAIKKLIDEET
jgi:hypothetical protein